MIQIENVTKSYIKGRNIIDGMNLEIKNSNLVLNKAISQVWKSKQYSYENFARPDHGLLHLFSGNITYKFDHHQIEVKPGDIIYLPKSSKYVVDFNLKNVVVEDYLINFDVMEGKIKLSGKVNYFIIIPQVLKYL